MMMERTKTLFRNNIIYSFIVLFLLILAVGCSKEGPKQGDLVIVTKKSNGESLDCKLIAYSKENHIDEIAQGISGLDMYLKEGVYDIKIDWRGNMKWINDVQVTIDKKFTDTIIFPSGKLTVKSVNKDKSAAAASVLVVPDRDPEKGVEISQNEDGYITQLFFLGNQIQIGNSLETVEKVLKPEMLRSPVIRDKDGMSKYETRYYKVLGANVDITFVKEGATPFKIESMDFERKVGAGIADEAIELFPGVYDIKVIHEGTEKWQDNVEIKDLENKEIEFVFEQGWILVKASNDVPDIKNLPITIYQSGDRNNPIKSGRINEKVSIVPGVYDVIIGYKGKSQQIMGLRITDGKAVTKTINLPN